MIHYLIAGFGTKPNGGLRIIYEQARRLAERGYRVELHHFERFRSDRLRRLPRQLWRLFKARNIARPDWIDLPDTVTCRYRFAAKAPAAVPGDQVIATFWKTHELIDDRKRQGVKYFYLIQGFETWLVSEDRLFRQWRDSSVNLVVSKWLQHKVNAVAGQAHLIPNAVDFGFFRNESPDRDGNRTILFCSMAAANKGSADVIAALNELHRAGVRFEAISFGDRSPSELGLIGPCRHYQRPDQAQIRDLYNAAAIFVSASYSEGWGLTLAEATLCGCTLLVSDAEGHFEFARPGRSAFFFRRGASGVIARKLKFLLQRAELRKKLQQNALADLAPYNWDRSIDRLEAALRLHEPEG